MNASIIKSISYFYNQTQFSIALVQGSKFKFYGFCKENNEIKLVDNSNLVFEISSITKVFTANILAQLALEKKLKLDDEISAYLAIESLHKTKINFLQLANHSSGLARLPSNFYSQKNYDEKDPYRTYDEKALLTYLNHALKLEARPGEKFAYSNLGFGLLSYLFSQIEQKSFDAIVQDRIFRPLGMGHSTFDITQSKTALVSGLNKDGDIASNWNGGILNGALGILSTAKDMVKFIRSTFDENNRAVNLQMKKTIPINANHFVGLAWGIRENDSSKTSYNHGGGSDGYTAHLKINRKEKKGIILLTNVSAFHQKVNSLEELAFELVDRIDEIDD